MKASNRDFSISCKVHLAKQKNHNIWRTKKRTIFQQVLSLQIYKIDYQPYKQPFRLPRLGMNALASSFFTALGNGWVSAFISFCRTFLFQALSVLVLPLIIGLDGIWLALAVGEFICLFVSYYYYRKYKTRYNY